MSPPKLYSVSIVADLGDIPQAFICTTYTETQRAFIGSEVGFEINISPETFEQIMEGEISCITI